MSRLEERHSPRAAPVEAHHSFAEVVDIQADAMEGKEVERVGQEEGTRSLIEGGTGSEEARRRVVEV